MSRLRTGEGRVFGVATAIALVHALDDAFVHRGPGLLAFERLRPGLRAALAFVFGGLAVVNGATHAIHIDQHGAGGADLTGALALAAGVVLLGLAAALPWRHRGERGGWATRARGVPARACSSSARSGWASSRRTSGASRSASRRARRTVT
jgi:hypothetical protein